MTTVGYLGPVGTFTHQAAQRLFPLGEQLLEFTPFASVPEVFAAVAVGQVDFGVTAIENTVEGPVYATIDGLLASRAVVAVGAQVLPIQFDAYALAGQTEFQYGVAHPHALAQVNRYLDSFGLNPVAAASNGAALAELLPGQVAFGPPGYLREGVVRLAENVGDYSEALTRFLLLARRNSEFPTLDPEQSEVDHTLLAIVPTATGPGVLARITEQFAVRGLNMSSLISRPLKGREGQFVFIVTFDASPWAPASRALFTELLAAGDAIKTLGVWKTDPDGEIGGAVLPDAIPPAFCVGTDSAVELARSLLW
jgi:prephenate dehydratase/chorismate mutase/prephenate dehydratase